MTLRFRISVWVAAALAAASAMAAVVPEGTGRFDRKVLQDPSTQIGTVAESPDRIAGFDGARAGWQTFASSGAWTPWVDRRSGSPLLVQGPGLRWFAPGEALSASGVEAKARALVSANEALFGVRNAELVWNGSASTVDGDRAVVVFDRYVGGVPVEGERFIATVNHGNLTSFGATRWGRVPAVTQPAVASDAAYAALSAYMGLTPQDGVESMAPAGLVLVAKAPASAPEARYAGAAGAGIDHVLAWRFTLRVAGEPGTWTGKVDAATGKVIALYDEDMYSATRGGVYPVSNDGDCANGGCELAGVPMPYANVTVAKSTTTSGDMGIFACVTKGNKNSSTTFTGTYVKVVDTCGLGSDSGSCTADLDWQSSTGTDCTTPSGQGAGDTHSARLNFYALNRLKEKARYWLPSNAWAGQSLTANVDTVATCNAYWNGSVNFYKSGGGCRNTGEILGVVAHEYGHGLDQNDGGGYDNPSEGYADVVSIIQNRASCVGRGFFQSGTCSGYGDTCLTCTGIRDMDFAQRVRNTPATPASFTAPNCGGGGGPCGREVHCESYVVSETIFDLATRDLPATGLDADSAWQLTEKLFYKSRQGSGGNAFNCALPSSDGCNANGWFNSMRNADDDDGNLANGTPHAAAIFSAFNRHGIACGAATDAANSNTSSCGTLVAPTVTASAGSGQVTISWSAVPGAANYLVLRNDFGCGYSSNVIATVAAPGTSYTDTALPPGFKVYYRVQAQGSNKACDGPTSACVQSAGN